MKCLLAFAAFALVGAASAQTATLSLVQWNVGSGASAGPLSASDGSSGFAAADPFFKGAEADVDYFDIVGASAYGSTSADARSEPGFLGAAIYGYVETTDDGAGASAAVSAFIEVDFVVDSPYFANIYFYDASSKNFQSLLQKWNGTHFDTFLGSGVGFWQGTLDPGTYRWIAADNLSVSGSGGELFSHTMRVQPVPEPATFAALAAGLACLTRRRSATRGRKVEVD